MSDIARIVIFKKENGEEFTFDDKYVQLTSLENKMLIFKFEASQDILKEGAEFFNQSGYWRNWRDSMLHEKLITYSR